jgi:hypothetical protein
MNEADEIMQTVEHLQQVLENLIVRGLRSAGSQERSTLQALRDEFDRIGAHHLASRIGTLSGALQNDDRSAAAALLKTQASVRVFERVLTLQCAEAALKHFTEGSGNEPE